MEKIKQFFNDPVKVSRLAVGLFFAFAILAGIYLATLPSDLVYEGGMTKSGRASYVFFRLYAIIALTFGACYAAIHYVRKSRREIIVYVDKKTSAEQQEQATASTAGSLSLNVAALSEKISGGANRQEKWQLGLNSICHQLNAGQGALYKSSGKEKLDLVSGFALVLNEDEPTPSFLWGDGLIGQVAASGKAIYLDELPEGYAARVASGLGSALPKFLYIAPVLAGEEVWGAVEFATFQPLSETTRKQLQQAVNLFSGIS